MCVASVRSSSIGIEYYTTVYGERLVDAADAVISVVCALLSNDLCYQVVLCIDEISMCCVF